MPLTIEQKCEIIRACWEFPDSEAEDGIMRGVVVVNGVPIVWFACGARHFPKQAMVERPVEWDETAGAYKIVDTVRAIMDDARAEFDRLIAEPADTPIVVK